MITAFNIRIVELIENEIFHTWKVYFNGMKIKEGEGGEKALCFLLYKDSPFSQEHDRRVPNKYPSRSSCWLLSLRNPI